MSHQFESKRVKVKKNHRCHGCNKDIKINESATKHSQIFDGSFYNSYFCDDCQNWDSVVCANCRECWENENCFEGYILDCKIETCDSGHCKTSIDCIKCNPRRSD